LLDFQMLLYPFEKQFNRPPFSIKFRNSFGIGSEIICQKDECSILFNIVITDFSKFFRVTFWWISPMAFPYGILVNRKGVIVDYGSHVRPANMLREKIDLLLEQDNLLK